MPFDLTSTRLVLAGTVYGECSIGGRAGMENVAAVVLQRLHAGWAATPIGVCLAPAQFSCWFDINRRRIENAAVQDPAGWAVALAVADAAIGGTLPVRTRGADSYYALTMPTAPGWARSPAQHVWSDGWHSFWSVRPLPADAPVGPDIAVLAAEGPDAEALNDAELLRIADQREAIAAGASA